MFNEWECAFYLFLCRIMRHMGSQFFTQRLNLHPLHRKHGILTTGPPGKSPETSLIPFLKMRVQAGASQVVLAVKNLPTSAGDIRDTSLIPGWGRPPGEENGNPLQYSCLDNSMNRGGWWAKVLGSQRVGHDWVTNTFTFKYPIQIYPFTHRSWFWRILK